MYPFEPNWLITFAGTPNTVAPSLIESTTKEFAATNNCYLL